MLTVLIICAIVQLEQRRRDKRSQVLSCFSLQHLRLLQECCCLLYTSGYSEKDNAMGMAADVTMQMKPEAYYVVGPGTTTRPVMEKLGLPHTLLGMDIVKDGKLVKADAAERDIYELTEQAEVYLILTVLRCV